MDGSSVKSIWLSKFFKLTLRKFLLKPTRANILKNLCRIPVFQNQFSPAPPTAEENDVDENRGNRLANK
jgi:hypothetical protein